MINSGYILMSGCFLMSCQCNYRTNCTEVATECGEGKRVKLKEMSPRCHGLYSRKREHSSSSTASVEVVKGSRRQRRSEVTGL